MDVSTERHHKGLNVQQNWILTFENFNFTLTYTHLNTHTHNRGGSHIHWVCSMYERHPYCQYERVIECEGRMID